MKDLKQIALFAVVAVVAGSTLFTACHEDPPPPPPPVDHIDHQWDDSTGIAISDTLVVQFGDERWTTLNYEAILDESDPMSPYRWVNVTAHAPGAAFPRLKMHMVLVEGNHSSHMTVNDPGTGYTIPGRLTGDGMCGYIYYYENEVVHSPDGTVTSDWWPWDVTMSVLEYNREEELLTARVIATMFDYASWLNREVLLVDSAERRQLIVSFGNLKVQLPED